MLRAASSTRNVDQKWNFKSNFEVFRDEIKIFVFSNFFLKCWKIKYYQKNFFIFFWPRGLEPATLGFSSERYTNCAMTDQLGETFVCVLKRFIERSWLIKITPLRDQWIIIYTYAWSMGEPVLNSKPCPPPAEMKPCCQAGIIYWSRNPYTFSAIFPKKSYI